MNQIFIRGNEIATKEYVDSLGGGSSSVIENIKAVEGENTINYDRDIRDRMENGETKYFYLENALVVSDSFGLVLYGAGTILKVSTAVNGGDATTTDVLKSEDEIYELNFVIFGDGTRSYSVHKVEYATKSEISNAGPKSHDGEGMIGWFNTAADGENLTDSYGVTPSMVRSVNIGDVISWPSRVQSGAYESALCIYKMEYETYVKDFGEYYETIDIKIGKSPDSIYTYIIADGSVFKNTI